MERILYATTRFPRTGLQTTESLTDTLDRQARAGAIIYIDNQRLRRDCVTEQLAMRLPEMLIEAVAEVYDLSKEDIDTHRFALGILNKHSTHIGKPELAKQLSFLATTAPNLPLALFSDLDEADDIAEAFKLGIRGYIPTSLPSAGSRGNSLSQCRRKLSPAEHSGAVDPRGAGASAVEHGG